MLGNSRRLGRSGGCQRCGLARLLRNAGERAWAGRGGWRGKGLARRHGGSGRLRPTERGNSGERRYRSLAWLQLGRGGHTVWGFPLHESTRWWPGQSDDLSHLCGFGSFLQPLHILLLDRPHRHPRPEAIPLTEPDVAGLVCVEVVAPQTPGKVAVAVGVDVLFPLIPLLVPVDVSEHLAPLRLFDLLEDRQRGIDRRRRSLGGILLLRPEARLAVHHDPALLARHRRRAVADEVNDPPAEIPADLRGVEGHRLRERGHGENHLERPGDDEPRRRTDDPPTGQVNQRRIVRRSFLNRPPHRQPDDDRHQGNARHEGDRLPPYHREFVGHPGPHQQPIDMVGDRERGYDRGNRLEAPDRRQEEPVARAEPGEERYDQEEDRIGEALEHRIGEQHR